MNLPQALDIALTRRLYPHSRLSPKQLAWAIGRDVKTLWRWRTGQRSILAEDLFALISFFRSRGDISFESEMMAVSRETKPVLSLIEGSAWRVERLPLDGLRHPTAQRLAHLASQETDLLTAADNAGLLPECGLFRESGEVIHTLGIGRSSQMRPSIRKTMMGVPVELWPDRPYASMVAEHLREASRNGPSYHSMKGTVHGIPAHYERVVYPAGEFLLTYSMVKAA